MSLQHTLVAALMSIELLLYGCTSGAAFPELDYKVKEPDWVELMNNSDLILLGSVLGSEELGPIRSFGSDPRRVQLQKVHLSVEYVLKGSATEPTIPFYRYTLAGPVVNAPGPDFLSLGDRGVFFLNRAKDVFRAALDVGPPRLPVWSGIEGQTFSRFQGLPLPEQIARLMLASKWTAPSFEIPILGFQRRRETWHASAVWQFGILMRFLRWYCSTKHPGSNSTVVTPAVEPATKTVACPSCKPLFASAC